MNDTDTCYCGHVADEHERDTRGRPTKCAVLDCPCVHYENNPEADDEPAPNHPTPASSAGSDRTDTPSDTIALLRSRIDALDGIVSWLHEHSRSDEAFKHAFNAHVLSEDALKDVDRLTAALSEAEAELRHARTFAPPNAFGAHTMEALLGECETYRAALTAKDAELAGLKQAGARLANAAYNLAQRDHLTADERRSLDESRRLWDAARASTDTTAP